MTNDSFSSRTWAILVPKVPERGSYKKALFVGHPVGLDHYPSKFVHLGPKFGLDPKNFLKFQLGLSYTSCDKMTKRSLAKVGLMGRMAWLDH